MKKLTFNTLLYLDRFPTVIELQEMTLDELEAFVESGRKELENMQNLIDSCEEELKGRIK
jgi:uncharacterized coiled-coil protein SlyX